MMMVTLIEIISNWCSAICFHDVLTGSHLSLFFHHINIVRLAVSIHCIRIFLAAIHIHVMI